MLHKCLKEIRFQIINLIFYHLFEPGRAYNNFWEDLWLLVPKNKVTYGNTFSQKLLEHPRDPVLSLTSVV